MQQVADWLEKLGLGQYAERFAENDIDFAVLAKLNDADLKELGVTSLGHRKRLSEAIAERAAGPSPMPAEPKAPDTAERRQVTVMFLGPRRNRRRGAFKYPQRRHTPMEIIGRNPNPDKYSISEIKLQYDATIRSKRKRKSKDSDAVFFAR
jgi:SAM domain (Sterile alpha motif)